jgi:hypothetical protein
MNQRLYSQRLSGDRGDPSSRPFFPPKSPIFLKKSPPIFRNPLPSFDPSLSWLPAEAGKARSDVFLGAPGRSRKVAVESAKLTLNGLSWRDIVAHGAKAHVISSVKDAACDWVESFKAGARDSSWVPPVEQELGKPATLKLSPFVDIQKSPASSSSSPASAVRRTKVLFNFPSSVATFFPELPPAELGRHCGQAGPSKRAAQPGSILKVCHAQ